jgi:hypothetical protein
MTGEPRVRGFMTGDEVARRWDAEPGRLGRLGTPQLTQVVSATLD